MEMNVATAMLSALGHEGRLAIFRLLVEAGPEGLAAGEVARTLGVLPNSLSANLAVLSHAGLLTARREGRSIIYAVDFSAMARMLEFLIGDCCNGAPEVCGPLASLLHRCAPGRAEACRS